MSNLLCVGTAGMSVWFSRDNGETFAFQELQSPWQYTRTIVPRADGDKTVFLTNGNGPPGSTGRLLRSTDASAATPQAVFDYIAANTDRIADRSLALPFHGFIEQDEVRFVVKTLKDAADKVQSDEKERIEAAIKALEEAIKKAE